MALRWFVDESALGLGKLLARIRDDAIYAGHRRRIDADRGPTRLGGIRRDRRIHTRRLEVRVFNEVGLRRVWLGGKKDMSSHQQLDLIVRYWQALEARQEDLGPGPWSVTLLGGGLSPRLWRPQR